MTLFWFVALGPGPGHLVCAELCGDPVTEPELRDPGTPRTERRVAQRSHVRHSSCIIAAVSVRLGLGVPNTITVTPNVAESLTVTQWPSAAAEGLRPGSGRAAADGGVLASV